MQKRSPRLWSCQACWQQSLLCWSSSPRFESYWSRWTLSEKKNKDLAPIAVRKEEMPRLWILCRLSQPIPLYLVLGRQSWAPEHTRSIMKSRPSTTSPPVTLHRLTLLTWWTWLPFDQALQLQSECPENTEMFEVYIKDNFEFNDNRILIIVK